MNRMIQDFPFRRSIHLFRVDPFYQALQDFQAYQSLLWDLVNQDFLLVQDLPCLLWIQVCQGNQEVQLFQLLQVPLGVQ